MADPQQQFDLVSLRGGLDDTTPPNALQEDACVVAENVEFFYSTLGERRKGCVAITLPDAIATPTTLDAVTWLYRHLPVNNEGEAELWAMAQALTPVADVYTTVLARNRLGVWEVIVPNDAINAAPPQGHQISAQTIHGKLFVAYKSSVDRLHVWDGSSLRRAGLAEPAAPTADNSDDAGTLSGVRYYRVRYVVMDGTTALRRSEPSESIEFTPSGSKDAVVITKPATIDEMETHWEVEASMDDANFYRIARVEVGTTTYADSTPTTGYAILPDSVLSEDVGDYTLVPSAKYLSVDEDRLIFAGSWEDPDKASQVGWTPVYGASGIGNDERMEFDTDPTLNLDGYEGGEITGLSRAVNGYLYIFKRSHIYKFVRTGRRSQAYEAVPMTKARGALPGSLVEAVDQAGQPSQYFLDPSAGPMRIGSERLQWVGRDIQGFWRRVNVNATVPCHGVYYNDKRQIHYWLAIDGAEYPNAKLVLHVNEVRNTDEGARRGWVTVAKDDRIATAHCSAMFAANVDTTDDRSFALVPFIGKAAWAVGANTIRQYVQRCDVGSTDAHTTGDTDSGYRALVRSKHFSFAGLLNHYGVLAGAVLAKAFPTPDSLVFVRAVRDFGRETKTVRVELLADGAEDHVIKPLDDLNFAEITALQIELGDLDDNVTPPEEWQLFQLQLKLTGGSKA